MRTAIGCLAVMAAAIGDYARFLRADMGGMARNDADASCPLGWPVGRGAIVYRWDARGDTIAFLALLPLSMSRTFRAGTSAARRPAKRRTTAPPDA